MKKLIVLCISLISLNSSPAISDDYGVGHATINYFAGIILPEINNELFPNHPNLARILIDIELSALVYYWCNREAKARGTWDISEWDELYGSYDSTMDCVLPAAVTGYQLTKDGFMFNIIDYKW